MSTKVTRCTSPHCRLFLAGALASAALLSGCKPATPTPPRAPASAPAPTPDPAASPAPNPDPAASPAPTPDPAPAPTPDPAPASPPASTTAPESPSTTSTPPASPAVRVFRENWPNGAKKFEYQMSRNGEGKMVRNGWLRAYYLEGQLEREGNYHNGVRVGKWRWYKQNGQLDHESDFGAGRAPPRGAPPEE